MERGLFPIVPRHRIQGPKGSTAELAVKFNGGVRSYFDRPVTRVYDEALARRRYEQVNTRYRAEIEVPGIRAERQAGHARPPSWLVRHQTRMYRQAL